MPANFRWPWQPPSAPIELNGHAPRTTFAIGDDQATWQALANPGQTWAALVGGYAYVGRVTRFELMRCAAFKRARDLIAGTIGTLPLHTTNAFGEDISRPLLEQPENMHGLVRCVTITRTIEDLMADSTALWEVLTRDSAGFPVAVYRWPYGRWSQDPTTLAIKVDGRDLPSENAIVFTSPNDPLTVAAAPTIRAMHALELLSQMYIAEPEPAAYFTPKDETEPDDVEVIKFLTQWRDSRSKRATGYVPGNMSLNGVPRLTPEEMQLVGAKDYGIREISRLTGVDGEWLTVHTTSRTYFNSQDSRRHFTDYVISPYLHAIEERLSLGDVTPRGQLCRFNLNAFLRGGTKERYESYALALTWQTVNEIRATEGLPPIEGGDVLHPPSAATVTVTPSGQAPVSAKGESVA